MKQWFCVIKGLSKGPMKQWFCVIKGLSTGHALVPGSTQYNLPGKQWLSQQARQITGASRPTPPHLALFRQGIHAGVCRFLGLWRAGVLGGGPPQKPAAEAGPFSACWPSAAWLSHGRTVPSSSQGAGRIPCCPSDLCNTTPAGFRCCMLLHAQRGTPEHVPYYYYAPVCVTTEISAGLVSILKTM